MEVMLCEEEITVGKKSRSLGGRLMIGVIKFPKDWKPQRPVQ